MATAILPEIQKYISIKNNAQIGIHKFSVEEADLGGASNVTLSFEVKKLANKSLPYLSVGFLATSGQTPGKPTFLTSTEQDLQPYISTEVTSTHGGLPQTYYVCTIHRDVSNNG
jgi:hypothetical protein